MAGAGIEVKLDSEYQKILDALKKASMPSLQKLADFGGSELFDISMGAFKNETDPVTGNAWEKLKHPRKDGSTNPILQLGGQLKRGLTWNAFPDGSVLFGSNMKYAQIHQEGGKAGRSQKSFIPARPYMGVPKDFERNLFDDPAVLDLLGLGE